MKPRRLALALLFSACAFPAFGQVPPHGIGVETVRNNCWPMPFTAWDRAAVASPFAVMVENGWRKQNMLADHHFDGTGAALNDAGRNKLRWILNEAPEQHRTIYVRRAESLEKSAARYAAVQQAAAGLAPPGARILVLETNLTPAGWPAERIEMIGRKFQASTPEPRLGKPDSAGNTSASGNGSAK
jgi:hypothetical protein